VLCAVAGRVGIYWYGWSTEVNERFWFDIFARAARTHDVPILSAAHMAAFAAAARRHQRRALRAKAFFWTALWDHTQRTGVCGKVSSRRRGSCARHLMDVYLPARVEHRFYPAEAVMIAILHGGDPYFVFGGSSSSVARWWFARWKANSTA
jgi:hypothetical protein